MGERLDGLWFWDEPWAPKTFQTNSERRYRAGFGLAQYGYGGLVDVWVWFCDGPAASIEIASGCGSPPDIFGQCSDAEKAAV
jgi:hypothetical protein